MATRDALALYLSSLDRKTYYDILGVPRDASQSSIKEAFHAFSLRYHPDRHVDGPQDSRPVAAEIYKRAVEAYGCLTRPATRQRYDRAMARGKTRLEPWRPSSRPPPPPMRTLGMIAQTPRAKKLAEKADRLISIGKLEDARVELVSACQCEPANEELADRVRLLYDALALEPP
jgi:curved DNA-binding protein CbpA